MTERESMVAEPAQLGRATAWRVLAALEEKRLVARFVDGYAREHNRRELKTSPLRYRELLITLTRESLVAAAARIHSELPRRLAGGARGKSTAAQAEATDAFQQALVQALASALHWTPGDAAEFARDVALYARMTAFTEPARAAAPRASKAQGAMGKAGATTASRSAAAKSPLQVRSLGTRDASRSAGPFADRCALLLDPSLLEKARASAAAFHAELERVASAALGESLRQGKKEARK